jgi:hypothetical protein
MNTDLLARISSNLDDETLEILFEVSKFLNDSMKIVYENKLFWKERVEFLFDVKLDIDNVDWEKAYQVLNKQNNNILRMKYAIRESNYDAVLVLMKIGFDPAVNENNMIEIASRNKNPDIVELLLTDPKVDPSVNNNKPIKEASFYGNSEVILVLLKDPRVNPSVDDNYPIVEAIKQGHIETVKILLKYITINLHLINKLIDISMSYNRAEIFKILLSNPMTISSWNHNQSYYDDLFREAVKKRNSDSIVKILLNDFSVNPNGKDGKALINAVLTHHFNVVRVLLEDNRTNLINANYLMFKSLELGKTDIAMLFLDNPKTNVFVDNLPKTLDLFVRNYISDSFIAVSFMHYKYYYNNDNNDNTSSIYSNSVENKDNMARLYYEFLRYLIRKKSYDLVNPLKFLTDLVKSYDQNVRLIVYYATKSILNPNFKIPNDMTVGTKSYYYMAFKGFLMMAYTPEYAVQEILYIISKKQTSKEIIYLTAKLLGAYVGFEKLLEQGYKYTNYIKNKLEYINIEYMSQMKLSELAK